MPYLLHFSFRPPSAVQPRHRRLAQGFWCVSLAAFVGYCGYLINDVYEQRKDPPGTHLSCCVIHCIDCSHTVLLTYIALATLAVSIKVESRGKGQFDLPDIGVCLEPTRGCGSGNTVASCLQGGEAVVTLKDGFMLPATLLPDPAPVYGVCNLCAHTRLRKPRSNSSVNVALKATFKLQCECSADPEDEAVLRGTGDEKQCDETKTPCSKLRATFQLQTILLLRASEPACAHIHFCRHLYVYQCLGAAGGEQASAELAAIQCKQGQCQQICIAKTLMLYLP
eukprot:19302-Heterococcus_DN1.PRE.1